MAHVGEKGCLRLVGELGELQRVPEGLPAQGQLLVLQAFPHDGFFQLRAVLVLFVLVHEAVEQAAAHHEAHGVAGHEGKQDLHGNEHRHGKAEEADGHVAAPIHAFGAGGGADGVDGGQREEPDLGRQGRIERQALVVCALDVKPEEDGIEAVDRNEGRFADKEGGAHVVEGHAVEVALLQIGDDVARPEHDREGHGKEVERRVDEERGDQVALVEQAPGHVGGVVGHDAQQEAAVVLEGRRELPPPVVLEHVLVDDQQDDERQYANDGIGHAAPCSRPGDPLCARVRDGPDSAFLKLNFLTLRALEKQQSQTAHRAKHLKIVLSRTQMKLFFMKNKLYFTKTKWQDCVPIVHLHRRVATGRQGASWTSLRNAAGISAAGTRPRAGRVPCAAALQPPLRRQRHHAQDWGAWEKRKPAVSSAMNAGEQPP